MKKRLCSLTVLVIVIVAGVVFWRVSSNSLLPLNSQDVQYIELWEMNRYNPKDTIIRADTDSESEETIVGIITALNQLKKDDGVHSFDKDDVIFDMTIHMKDNAVYTVTCSESVIRVRSSHIERFQSSTTLVEACKKALYS